MDELENLWGDEFAETSKEKKAKTKKLVEKVSKPKQAKAPKEASVTKQLKSKDLDIDDQLALIKTEVFRILGKQQNNVVVINDYDSYINYINQAIKSGIIAIDTETNNSLDPITCKLMGLCLYYPGGKQAYIPVNHRDPHTKVRLENQLNEQQIADGLNILINQRPTYNSDIETVSYGEWYDMVIFPNLEKLYTKVITHNGKFDYEVLKCTCGVKIPNDWDTFIGAKLINENEYSAGLKQQYIEKIDPDQEKYSIDHLFEGVEYADVDPEVFALYAATDSYMTYKLMEYQKPILELSENFKIYKLFRQVEMPLVEVLAEMEMAGMEIDQKYAKRLSDKLHHKLEDIDNKLMDILKELEPTISEWKLTPDALNAQKKKQSEKQRANALKSPNYDDSLWSYSNGEWYKLSKSKIEQLDSELTPKSLSSPTQLAIILYSILKCPVVNKESPLATGEEELNKIKDYAKDTEKTILFNLCDLMLNRRELVKLLSTYVDNLPEIANRWPDGRIRTHFNQYGAQTGRLSSSDPVNFQNIPSHQKAVRLIFKAHEDEELINCIKYNEFEVNNYVDVETSDGWKSVKKLAVGDILICNDEKAKLLNITQTNNKYLLQVEDI